MTLVERVLAGLGTAFLFRELAVMCGWWIGLAYNADDDHPGWWRWRELPAEREWKKIGGERRT